MRTSILGSVLILGCASFGCRDSAPLEKGPAQMMESPGLQDPARWQEDPACRMIFFAVLEGLYTDGVPTAVVDLIVPKEGDGVQHSFVVQCPLCHPVFEAFRLYQSRKPFASDTGKSDTFGKEAVKAEILEGLKNPDVYPRIRAMGALVQPWIERRLALMRLSQEEMQDWREKLLARAKEGGDKFEALKRKEGTVYRAKWQFYDGCQACKAVERAVK